MLRGRVLTDWTEFRRQWTGLLVTQLYPAIAGDPHYEAFLARSGANARLGSIAVQARAALAVHARAEASRIAALYAATGEQTALRVELLRGPLALASIGEFCFPAPLMEAAEREAGDGKLEWLETCLGRQGREASTAYLPDGRQSPAIRAAAPLRRKFGRYSWRKPGVPQYRYWAEIDKAMGEVPRWLLPYRIG
ncbi:MAG: hypothetical protein JNL98_25475 [Bryobacterales bacterium]|nr:hypothetical protein [Bryobacterales bacterium]